MAKEQKALHMLTEFLAVFLLVPFFWSLIQKDYLHKYDKYFLLIIIITTIVVDGYLFLTWLKK